MRGVLGFGVWGLCLDWVMTRTRDSIVEREHKCPLPVGEMTDPSPS